MKILAIDLGKNKSVFILQQANDEALAGKVSTDAQSMHDLLVKHAPDRLVIEAGPSAGWVSDLALGLGIEVQVANGNDERWRWKQVKHKSDRADAQKLLWMSQKDCLPQVHVPKPLVRQWRALIQYRSSLVDRRTAVKNSIRSLFERQGLKLPSGARAWGAAAVQEARKEFALEASSAEMDQLWRFELHCEYEQLEKVQQQIAAVEAKLQECGAQDKRVAQLQTAPYVGPRLSEAVVAIIDDPHRFKSGREVACYVGLTPRRWQSGDSDRQGHISRAGPRLLRELLVEIAWLGVNGGTWMKQVYENVRRGSDQRKKIAIVAVARRLLVRLWAMARDGTVWREAVLSPG